MSSTSMKEAVMASIPSNRAFDPHPVQLNNLGNFILTNYLQETFPIWNNKWSYFAATLFFLIIENNQNKEQSTTSNLQKGKKKKGHYLQHLFCTSFAKWPNSKEEWNPKYKTDQLFLTQMI